MEHMKKFVLYSIRYQIILAQHVAKKCNTKIYIFDSNEFFDSKDVVVEIIDDIRTVLKDGQRAVLSMAVKESFGSNEALFLEFVDKSATLKDDIGLYVSLKDTSKVIEEEDLKDTSKVIEEEDLKDTSKVIEEEEDLKDTSKVIEEEDLKDITDAIKKLEFIL